MVETFCFGMLLTVYLGGGGGGGIGKFTMVISIIR